MTETYRSACPLDCPDACSLEVTVEGGRVSKIEGAADRNPLTAGFICAKVRKFPELVYGSDRLREPLIRVGEKGEGRFEPVSWDHALDLAATRLLETRKRYGGEAILPYSYGGSNGVLTQDTTDALLFSRLGASRLDRTICAAATGAAAQGLYGKMPGVAFPDYEHSNLIVLWGANPSNSGIHLVPILERARARGAKLAVIDPRATPLAKRADLHLAARPGSDVAVALALIRWLFASGRADRAFLAQHATGVEELRSRAEPWTIERAAATAEVPAEAILALAELYAASSPAVIRCGWGLERNRNGGSAVAAVLALPAVAGKFLVRGGGYTLSNSAAWRFGAESIFGPEATSRSVNMNRLGQALTELADPRVHLLFVYNSNALMTAPRQDLVRRGLGREDLFTIVFDSARTDTALWADLVLPATTFLEHRELTRGYGAFVLHAVEPVVEPVGDARPNYEVFAELARRCGVARDQEVPDSATAIDRLLASTGRSEEIRRQLSERGFAEPESGPAPVQFVDVFPRTPDRKIHLVPDGLDREAPAGLYAYRADPASASFPLALISPASNRTISSTLGQLHRKPVALTIHPDDAATRGLSTGDRARVWNDLGEIVCDVRVSRDLRPGVVELPKGLWSHNTANGATACAVAPDTLTDLGGGACFNDARVEVARA